MGRAGPGERLAAPLRHHPGARSELPGADPASRRARGAGRKAGVLRFELPRDLDDPVGSASRRSRWRRRICICSSSPSAMRRMCWASREAGEELAAAIAARYGVPLVALTRPPDAEPGTLLLARGEFRYAPRYAVEVVDRIGAGDSLVAGLIHGPARRRSRSGDPSRRLCRGDRARHPGRHQLPRSRGHRPLPRQHDRRARALAPGSAIQHFTYRQVTRPVTIGPVT